MTDYCNSSCQRHRPAAATNRYSPGHRETCKHLSTRWHHSHSYTSYGRMCTPALHKYVTPAQSQVAAKQTATKTYKSERSYVHARWCTRTRTLTHTQTNNGGVSYQLTFPTESHYLSILSQFLDAKQNGFFRTSLTTSTLFPHLDLHVFLVDWKASMLITCASNYAEHYHWAESSLSFSKLDTGMITYTHEIKYLTWISFSSMLWISKFYRFTKCWNTIKLQIISNGFWTIKQTAFLAVGRLCYYDF